MTDETPTSPLLQGQIHQRQRRTSRTTPHGTHTPGTQDLPVRQTQEAHLAPDQPPVTYELDVPMWHGKPPLTLNQRLHWRARAERTRLIRDTITWTARQHHIPAAEHITVHLHYQPGDKRRRDTDNLVATLKPCIDGLVTAGIITDDDPTHVTWHPPTIHPGPGTRRLWLTIQVP